MTKFEKRPTVIWDLPLPKGKLLLRAEQAILRFAPGKSIDFGEFCYLRRSDIKRSKNQGREVDLTSICATRTKEIRSFIDCVNNAFTSSGQRPQALFSRYDRWQAFMRWCDENGHGSVLSDVSSARFAFRIKVAEMRRLVNQHLLNNNTAALIQFHIAEALEEYFGIDNLGQGVNLLAQNSDLKISTPVPDDEDQGKVLAWCMCLLSGFSDLVLNKTAEGKSVTFPFALRVPSYINRPGDEIWVFPLRQWCGHENSNWSLAYDYDNGRILSIDEMFILKPNAKKSDVVKAVKAAHANLARANEDAYHWARIARGLLGLSAFFVLFLAVTGANETPAAQMPWSEELEQNVSEPSTERQGFRTIKYRARGRLISFEIGLQYMPHLRRFLQLRNYLLMGKRCDHLFFNFGENSQYDPMAVQTRSLTSSFFRALRQISLNLPEVRSRQWRAAKQDYLIRREDPATAAKILQHSLSTALNAYSNGSEVTHQKEMGNFFSQLENVVLKKGKKIAGGQNRSLGLCASPQFPEPAVLDSPITPNCKDAEGCLFCNKYRVHADEIDTRKLLSARHCIRVTARYAMSIEEQERVFGHIIRRIEFFVGEISRRDKDLVTRVEMEVDIKGELDPFWSAKLETLMALGMELS